MVAIANGGNVASQVIRYKIELPSYLITQSAILTPSWDSAKTVKCIMRTALEVGPTFTLVILGFLFGLHSLHCSYLKMEVRHKANFHPMSLIRHPSCLMLYTLAVQGESHRIGRHVD